MIDQLTPYELDIARMVAAGMTQRQIAAARGIGVNMVKTLQGGIYRKLAIKAGDPAAALAAQYARYRKYYPWKS